jgi:hypothetical protein
MSRSNGGGKKGIFLKKEEELSLKVRKIGSLENREILGYLF